MFQAIPIIADHLLEQAICTSPILVISPLQFLMFDQVVYLNSVGVSAAAIFDGQEVEILKNIKEGGLYSVVYASPELCYQLKDGDCSFPLNHSQVRVLVLQWMKPTASPNGKYLRLTVFTIFILSFKGNKAR